MLLFSRIKTWLFNENLASADVNAEFNNILNNTGSDTISGYSATVPQMQIQTDPGSVGNESLAETSSDEFERLRFAISRIIGQSYWYQTPILSINDINRILATGNVLPNNRIASGKVRSTSNQPAFLVADGTAAKVTLKGASTPFSYFVAGTQYSINTDVDLIFSSFAPSSGNTATVNDASLVGQASSKVQGEASTILTMSAAGANITALQGSVAAFKIVDGGNTEYFLGFVNSATQLTKCFRGYFFDSAYAPVPRIAINNADTITLLKLYWIFATTSGTLDSCQNNPTVSFSTPTSPSVGDFWFDLGNNLWKKYNGSAFVSSNSTLIGYAVVDTTKCLLSRAFDFYAAYDDKNTAELEIQDNNTVRTSRRDSVVSVAGNTIRFEKSEAYWIKPTNFDTGITDGTNKTFYIYLKDTGAVTLSDIAPYDRTSDLLGRYHPFNPWRSLGYVVTDGSSHFTSLVFWGGFDGFLNQASSLGADAIATLMSAAGSAVVSKKFVRPVVTNGVNAGDIVITTGVGVGTFSALLADGDKNMTNCQADITVVGNPVEISMVGTTGAENTFDANTRVVKIWRAPFGGSFTSLCVFSFADPSHVAQLPVSAFQFTDNPGAGTWTYKFTLSSAGGIGCSVTGSKLKVYEVF